PKMIETTALGAAFLAGLGVGIWKSPEEIRKSWKMDQIFKPNINTKKRVELKNKWATLVAKA
ncbi:MAG: hypothetical protein ACD_73C00812G0010, partial [uncultured bacterium]